MKRELKPDPPATNTTTPPTPTNDTVSNTNTATDGGPMDPHATNPFEYPHR